MAVGMDLVGKSLGTANSRSRYPKLNITHHFPLIISASFANGDTYEGEYRFDQRHGRGVYQWHDGRVFDGMFREDKRHGKGKFIWPDGAVYEGEFRNGQREGQGQYTFSDGGKYEGSWKDGRYSGYGVCSWEDGRCYKGYVVQCDSELLKRLI